MKMVGFWVWFLLAEAALLLLIVSCSSTHVMSSFISGDNVAATPSIRKLTEKINAQKEIDTDNMNLEDYQQIDPAPNSSTAVISGPIEHGTPLMPFVPKLSPPHHPFPRGSSLPPPA